MKNGKPGPETLEEVRREKQHLDKTIEKLLATKKKKHIGGNDLVALSVYLRDIYMGIENILRRILLSRKSLS